MHISVTAKNIQYSVTEFSLDSTYYKNIKQNHAFVIDSSSYPGVFHYQLT